MAYSDDIINLVIKHTIDGKSKKYISKSLDISINTINRWIVKYNYNLTNKIRVTPETIADHKKNNQHKSIKRTQFKQQIIDYVSQNAGCSLDDIYNAVNKLLSKSTICRYLKELDLTSKHINTYIVCKDIDKIETDRINFAKIHNQQLNNFDNFISIDESGFNIDEVTNKGYSEIGKPINKMTKHKKNKQRVSLFDGCI